MEEQEKLTILVAEDDPVMAKLLEFNLMRESYSVVICRDGRDVLTRIESIRPALILLDYVMPGATGMDILNELRIREHLTNIPVLMVTGQGRETVKNSLLNAGARAVFTKPFSTIELLQEIRNQLATSAT